MLLGRERALVCLVSAAAGRLDNTPMMAIGDYEHYSNWGDVRVPVKSRLACSTPSPSGCGCTDPVCLGQENTGSSGLKANSNEFL